MQYNRHMENLSIENSIHGWQVSKRCPDCKYIVFVNNGKDKDNCIKIVETKFEQEHFCAVTKMLLEDTLF